MKKRSIIITAIAMMAIVPTASAQQTIKEAFQEVGEYSGVSKVGEQKTAKVDANGVTIESNVTTIKVKGRNVQHAVFDRLKSAFKNEIIFTSMFEEETGNDNVEIDSALVHDLGLRRQWSIWRDGAEAVLIGGMKNSSYLIANFNDKDHDGYRTCYAAEWSNGDDPDVYTAKLVYVYGRQPKTSVSFTEINPQNILGTASLSNGPSDIIRKQLDELGVKVDTCFTWSGTNFSFNNAPRDIPYTGSVGDWMNKAMENVKHLSNSDWHRFFGLLTQKMMDKANKESMEDLIVAAGIILDLCKNAEQLDDEERRISSNRLLEVALHFDSDKHQYIHDLLTLGARKLEKK